MSTTRMKPSDLAFKPSVDPVTFEILKHRLWQINEEQGTTLRRASGSPVATEVQDFNVGIANVEGQLVVAGMHLLVHVTGLSEVIANCIATVGAERIRPGDMFVTNDPWMGSVHQNDMAIVAPLHVEGRLVGWTGSVIHQSDVGGPVPGSWNLRAHDAFQEAPRYRFLRIVDGGEMSAEVLATITTNSRFPHLVELDLRAQAAAANVVRSRMSELFDKYGVDTVIGVMDDCLNNTEVMLRRRLLEIPDGDYYAEAHVDHDGHEDRITTIRLQFRKCADEMLFDFTRTDPQASGLINCTRSALISAPFSVVLTYLCAGIPWNEGVMRCVKVLSKPGTAVDCEFPAPVASGIVNTAWAALDACEVVVARMLMRSEKFRVNLMAVWAGGPLGVNIFGKNESGAAFGTLLGLSGMQGAGARTFDDGYDVAGYLHSPRCSAMNVETTEANYPILHLSRRLACDSGGPGIYRGGVGIKSAVMAYGARQFDVVTTSFGSDQSGSAGVGGGFPGGGANALLARDVDPMSVLRRDGLEGLLDGCEGSAEALPSKAQFSLGTGDVLLVVTHGGGGFGDPLEREAARVAADVRDGTVSREWAERVYGVVLSDDGDVDEHATDDVRYRIRRRRQEAITKTSAMPKELSPFAVQPAAAPTRYALSDLALGEAGPWLARRWGGDSKRFRLWLAIDPKTGVAFDAIQKRVDVGSEA